MEIEKNMVVSTSHITEQDSLLLAKIASSNVLFGDLIVYETEHWFLILLGGSKNLEGFSSEFKNLYELVDNYSDDLTFLKLDRDGPIIDFLPVFNW